METSEKTTEDASVKPNDTSNAMSLGAMFAAIAMVLAGGALVVGLTASTDNPEVNTALEHIQNQVDTIVDAEVVKVNGAVRSEGIQAVFLTDGQIYFGKLSDGEPGQWKLEDIYYLQVDEQTQAGITTTADLDALDGNQVSLAKLGNELHGPEDVMHIIPGNVLFWENLKDDSRVVTAITDFSNAQ